MPPTRKIMLTGPAVPVCLDGPDGTPRELAQLAWVILDSAGDTPERFAVRFQGKEAWVARSQAVPLADAVAFWTDKLMADPTDPQPWANRGVAHLHAGNPTTADTDLTEALRLKPACAPWHGWRATAKFRLGDLPGALADTDKVLRSGSATATAWTVRGGCHAAQGNHRRAVQDYAEAVALDPFDAAPFAGRAACWEALGQKARAVDDFITAAKLAPQDLEVRLARAAFRGRLGDTAGAAQDLAFVEMHASDAATLNALAWYLATGPVDDLRDGARATTLARRAFDLSAGTDAQCLDTLAAALAEAGDFTEAAQQQELALADRVFASRHGPAARQRLDLYRLGLPYREPG